MEDPFVTDVAAWVEKATTLANEAYQATVQDAVARVKELTPVVTGFLRANWQAVPAGQAASIQGSAPSAVISASQVISLGDTMVVTNAAPYAARIEFGFTGQDSLGRHFHELGRGMLQQTLAEMPQIAIKATARVIASQS